MSRVMRRLLFMEHFVLLGVQVVPRSPARALRIRNLRLRMHRAFPTMGGRRPTFRRASWG